MADRAQASVPPARPILKWAGGKRQLLPELRPYYPASFQRYVEPFVGSGAVFIDLHNAGLLRDREVHLSDVNADVIGCYRMVRARVEEVIECLEDLQAGHVAGPREHFYAVRDDRFNPARRSIQVHADPSTSYTPELAAMLIYLNRTGYNGLFRVNGRGDFNVPAGHYPRVRICDADNLRRVSAALREPGVTVRVQPFETVLAEAGPGDFVYLDPPYAPVSRTAAFTSYTADRFGPEQQEALQRAVVELAARGGLVLLSNSVASQIAELYDRSAEARRVGLRSRKVPARRAINSRGGGRGAVFEYLITNLAARQARQ